MDFKSVTPKMYNLCINIWKLRFQSIWVFLFVFLFYFFVMKMNNFKLARLCPKRVKQANGPKNTAQSEVSPRRAFADGPLFPNAISVIDPWSSLEINKHQ